MLFFPGSDDRSVKIWNLESAVVVRTIENVGADLTEVFFVRDDQFVLAAHNDGVSVVK